MTFNLFAWAIGFGLSKAAGRAITLATEESLASKLNDVARTWACALPPEHWLDPSALIAEPLNDQELTNRPQLEVLRTQLREKTIPDADVWKNALVEEWASKRIRLRENAQPFFLLPENEATAHLTKLAISLHSTCKNEEPLFRGTVLSLLDQIIASGLNPGTVGLPQPIARDGDPREIAKRVEAETGAHIHAVIKLAQSKRLWIWGRFFEGEVSKQRWLLACVARLVCELDEIESVHIGFSSASDLPGTNGSGLVGWLIVQIPIEKLRQLSELRTPPLDFWDGLPTYACAPEQVPFEHWHEIQLRSFEETLA